MPAVQSALSTSVAWNGPGSKSRIRCSCSLISATLWRQLVAREQVALLGLAARVADHAGRPAGQRERAMPGELEPAQSRSGPSGGRRAASRRSDRSRRRRRSSARRAASGGSRGRSNRGSIHARRDRRSGPCASDDATPPSRCHCTRLPPRCTVGARGGPGNDRASLPVQRRRTPAAFAASRANLCRSIADDPPRDAAC